MARRYITELRTDIQSRLPDNTSGLIDPADVRVNMLDFLDTVTPAYCAYTIDPAVNNVSVGTTPQIVTQWNNQVQLDNEFSFASGVVTFNENIVVDFDVNLNVTMPSNRFLTVESSCSASSYRWKSLVQGQGTNDEVSVSLNGVYAVTTGDTLQIECYLDNSNTVDFATGAFLTKLVPRKSAP